MENINLMGNFTNLVPEPERDEQDPLAGTNLMEFPILPLDGPFDINSCLPQTPFYELPFAHVASQEVVCSSSEQEGGDRHHPAQLLLSSPTKSATQPSRSLLSERKRRGTMKDKLLALRSLVPNITKMDKASLVGDAMIYVQELQKKATKLSEEISQLECCLQAGEGGGYEFDVEIPRDDIPQEETNRDKKSTHRKILQMVVIRTDNCQFYIKLKCNVAKGVVVGLLQVLEALDHIIIQASNLTILEGHINLTFTIQVTECSEEMNASALKLSLLTNFTNHGFDMSPAELSSGM